MSVASFRRPLLSLCVLAVLSVGVAAPAWAQDPPRERGRGQDRQEPRAEAPRAERAEPRARGDSLAESVRRFERSRGDRVLSAERMHSDGRDVNRIKAMDDQGRVRAYVDDPQRRPSPPPRQERTRGDDD
jgi:hypothetical protein